ncbi:hypothetical protein PO909_006612 [Leuciscus waleckii]
MTLVVMILSDQSVICSVCTSHFSIGTVRLEPQQRWYHLRRAEASHTVPYHAVEKRQSVPYRTEPYRTMQWKSAIWKTLARISDVNHGRVDKENEESAVGRVQRRLCVSGIYDSNIKCKYSTATLGVAV